MHAVANLVVDVLKVERMIPLEVAATPPQRQIAIATAPAGPHLTQLSLPRDPRQQLLRVSLRLVGLVGLVHFAGSAVAVPTEPSIAVWPAQHGAPSSWSTRPHQ